MRSYVTLRVFEKERNIPRPRCYCKCFAISPAINYVSLSNESETLIKRCYIYILREDLSNDCICESACGRLNVHVILRYVKFDKKIDMAILLYIILQ